MGAKETKIQSRILLSASKLGARLFRNNVGKGWIGRHIQLDDGSILIKQPRRINFGLCKGSADLIGWTPVKITQDMVGQTIPVFTAVECKTPKGSVSVDQRRFLAAVEGSGGIGIVGRHEKALDQYLDETSGHTQRTLLYQD